MNLNRLVLLVLLATVTLPAYAATSQKEKDTRELLRLMIKPSVLEGLANRMTLASIAREEGHHPNLPKGEISALSRTVRDIMVQHVDDLDDLLIPVYDKYYSDEEIKDLTVFFSSSTGRKYARISGPMTQDIGSAYRKWAKAIAPIATQSVLKVLNNYGSK